MKPCPRLFPFVYVMGLLFPLASAGCAGSAIEPGHRGLLFEPRQGGLKHEVLQPGYHSMSSCFLRSVCASIDDFDVTYSTRKELVKTTSLEGLSMDLSVAIIYHPIISELYELDTQIGQNYYDEVLGPEFRSAARGVFARHSYQDLQRQNEKIENEIEVEVRRRIGGKHIEVASVTMEQISYAPEIAQAIQAKMVGEQEALRQKKAIENDALRKKLELENAAEQAKLKAEGAIVAKRNEHRLADEQASIDKVKAEGDAAVRITAAKAQAQETTLLAEANAKQKRSEYSTITPLVVQMHAYDALGQLGGSGTHIMLGDWSRAPNFLFPHAVWPSGMPVAVGGGPAASK
ncbi:MAG: hypothetical protein NVS3B20_02230 [Polyangiales bacterium]